jgi:hypothetical protein
MAEQLAQSIQLYPPPPIAFALEVATVQAQIRLEYPPPIALAELQ